MNRTGKTQSPCSSEDRAIGFYPIWREFDSPQGLHSPARARTKRARTPRTRRENPDSPGKPEGAGKTRRPP